MKRALKTFAMVLLVILGLAALSLMTTTVVWDGGFPSGEIRIQVRDSQGQPIDGASLHIYRAGTRDPAYGYPISNHVAERELASDRAGQIVAVQKRDGLQFGGSYWKLFWVIPIGDRRGPRFDCEISAPGYRSSQFEVRRLFSQEAFPTTSRTVRETENEVRIFEQTFTLSCPGS